MVSLVVGFPPYSQRPWFYMIISLCAINPPRHYRVFAWDSFLKKETKQADTLVYFEKHVSLDSIYVGLIYFST